MRYGKDTWTQTSSFSVFASVEIGHKLPSLQDFKKKLFKRGWMVSFKEYKQRIQADKSLGDAWLSERDAHDRCWINAIKMAEATTIWYKILTKSFYTDSGNKSQPLCIRKVHNNE